MYRAFIKFTKKSKTDFMESCRGVFSISMCWIGCDSIVFLINTSCLHNTHQKDHHKRARQAYYWAAICLPKPVQSLSWVRKPLHKAYHIWTFFFVSWVVVLVFRCVLGAYFDCSFITFLITGVEVIIVDSIFILILLLLVALELLKLVEFE